MVKDTLQSVKAENDKLKEKVGKIFAELKTVQEPEGNSSWRPCCKGIGSWRNELSP